MSPNAGGTTLSGVISGSGGSFTTNGAATLTLSGANTYTGTTTVAQGTLVLSGSVVGPITVNSGATFRSYWNYG